MNFKKILFSLTAVLVTVGAVSCSSCASKPPPGPTPVPTVVAPPDAAPSSAVVKGPNWELTLPSLGWEANESCTPNGCQTVLLNPELKNVVMVVAKEYTGTVDEYVLTAVRGAREAGANLLSTKYVVVNGHNFVLLELSRGTDKIWLWFTILNGKGIELSCGGVDTDGNQHDICFGVVSTFKVN